MMKHLPFLLMLLLLGSCVKDQPMKREGSGFSTHIGDPSDLPTSSPEFENVNAEMLRGCYNRVWSDDEFVTMRSLLVARNGRLIAEAYFRDLQDQWQRHHLQSATKSVTSILTGIALQQGLLDSIQQPLAEILPEAFAGLEPQKQVITLQNLITMRGGLNFDNSLDTEPLINDAENSVQFVLEKELVYAPGEFFQYNDGLPHLLSAAIQAQAGMTLEEFAAANLFAPLSITEWQWEQHTDGITYGAFGLWLRPRDMLKLGQLMLQEGEWEGQQLVSPEWVVESTAIFTNATGGLPYGYYWWVLPDFGAYMAEGHGGQYIIVVPEEEMVIVATSDPYTSPSIWNRSDIKELLHCITDAAF